MMCLKGRVIGPAAVRHDGSPSFQRPLLLLLLLLLFPLLLLPISIAHQSIPYL